MANPGPLFRLLVLFATFLISTTCRATLPEKHVAFFIFGDSLFDAGNNNYLNGSSKTNFWPYGETFFHNATGRVCDGRTVPDFIAQYANLSFIPPYLQPGFDNYTDGANFASAGAGILAQTHAGTLSDLFREVLLHLKLQLSYFEEVVKQLKLQLGDAEAKKFLSKAVYLFSIGGNDYISITSGPNQSGGLTSEYKRQYMGMVLGNFTTVIKAIYKIGGRKFGFQNVGPLGEMPAIKSMMNTTANCVKEPQMLAKLHNIALSKILNKLATQLPEFRYSLFDYYTSLAKRTLYCSKYGFKVGKSACCGTGQYNGNFGSCGGRNGPNGTEGFELCSNPSEYVWFDAGHPTESTNKQLADLLWNGPPQVTGPYNFKMFF